MKQLVGMLLCLLLASMAALGMLCVSETGATTIYSYIDDQGNPVATDAPETIPEKYRAKVKTHERPAPSDQPASVSQSIERRLRTQLRDLKVALPSFHPTIEGLTPTQSEILTYAGGAAVVALLLVYVGKGPFTRLLGLALLMLLGIAVPVLMYVNDDGPLDHMRKKAASAGQAQQDRLQEPAR